MSSCELNKTLVEISVCLDPCCSFTTIKFLVFPLSATYGLLGKQPFARQPEPKHIEPRAIYAAPVSRANRKADGPPALAALISFPSVETHVNLSRNSKHRIHLVASSKSRGSELPKRDLFGAMAELFRAVSSYPFALDLAS